MFLVFLGYAYGIGGAVLDFIGVKGFPTWAWVLSIALTSIIGPFWLFHRMRLELEQMRASVSLRSQIAVHIMLLQTHLPVLEQIDTQKRMDEYRQYIQSTMDQVSRFFHVNAFQYLARLTNDPPNPPKKADALAAGCNDVAEQAWRRVKGRVMVLEEIYGELGRN